MTADYVCLQLLSGGQQTLPSGGLMLSQRYINVPALVVLDAGPALQQHWTRRWINVFLMLGQRRRRWPNIKTTLIQHLVFAEQPHWTRILLIGWWREYLHWCSTLAVSPASGINTACLSDWFTRTPLPLLQAAGDCTIWPSVHLDIDPHTQQYICIAIVQRRTNVDRRCTHVIQMFCVCWEASTGIFTTDIPANTIYLTNAGLLLVQRSKRWSNIKLTFGMQEKLSKDSTQVYMKRTTEHQCMQVKKIVTE